MYEYALSQNREETDNNVTYTVLCSAQKTVKGEKIDLIDSGISHLGLTKYVV